jgi:hypothetical protein
MTIKALIGTLAASILIVGCATRPAANQPAPAANQPTPAASATPAPQPAAKAAPQPATSGTRIVKSRNGASDGEIVGTIAAKSRFAKLQIGMSMREVSELIGAADDMSRHETGKRWIPFYHGGNDAQRIETLYKGEGCLTFTGGNVWGGGSNELIRITVAPKGGCMGS